MMPQSFDAFPDRPIAALLPLEAFAYDAQLVRPDKHRLPMVRPDLLVRRRSGVCCELILRDPEGPTWRGYVSPQGLTHTVDGGWIVELGDDERMPLAQFFQIHPPTIFFADSSNTTANHRFVPRDFEANLSRLDLVPWTWTGIDIRRETGPVRAGYSRTVQGAICDWCAQQDATSIVIVDDGAGEIADVIWLRTTVSGARVELIHAKYSHGDLPSHRLSDLYEVVGQAERSIRWLVTHQFWAELRQRLQTRSATKVVHSGSVAVPALLDTYAAAAPPTSWAVTVVQPGLRLTGLDAWIGGSTLLLRCHEWITQTGADFRVVGA
jgi:hypothetical protein